MSNYNITVGPARVFICKHPEPHDGPCERSTFVHGARCGYVHGSGEVCTRDEGHDGQHHSGGDGLGWES